MNKFEKVLLTLLFVELFIGGGGRLIDFGVLSIRQVLFITLIFTFIFRVFKAKSFFDKDVNTFIRLTPLTIGIYSLILWFMVSAVVGFINGHSLSIIVMDFFRVSYFAAYFPLAYYISKERFSLKKIITLIKYSALTVAIFTILITLLGKTIFVNNFDTYYRFLNTIMNNDLFFRPSNSVFYKSHFYAFVGLVLSLNALLSKKYSKIDILNVVLCSFSLIWSETRGFLLAFMISVLMIIALDTKILTDPVKGIMRKVKKLFASRQFLQKVSILIVIFVSVPVLYNYMTLARFEVESQTTEDSPSVPEYDYDFETGKGLIIDEEETEKKMKEKEEKEHGEPEVNDISVGARMSFILASKDILLESPQNMIFGTGYGTKIDGRENGIEMSFLDILVEQGIIGLFIWGFLFLQVFYNYYYVYRHTKKINTIEISLLSSFVGVLLLTNINPFINNPIGILFFLIVLVSSQNRKKQVQISK
jgi:hypothetical protein